MRAVVQRVSRAEVRVDGEVVGQIGDGFAVLIGVGEGDTDADAAWLANKLVGLRVFEDDDGLMNLAITDTGGAILLVSQFTLYGDCRKGRRPSFVKAMEPGEAARLCDVVATHVRDAGVEVQTGRFRATMQVELCNEGPVTLLLDSERTF